MAAPLDQVITRTELVGITGYDWLLMFWVTLLILALGMKVLGRLHSANVWGFTWRLLVFGGIPFIILSQLKYADIGILNFFIILNSVGLILSLAITSFGFFMILPSGLSLAGNAIQGVPIFKSGSSGGSSGGTSGGSSGGSSGGTAPNLVDIVPISSGLAIVPLGSGWDGDLLFTVKFDNKDAQRKAIIVFEAGGGGLLPAGALDKVDNSKEFAYIEGGPDLIANSLQVYKFPKKENKVLGNFAQGTIPAGTQFKVSIKIAKANTSTIDQEKTVVFQVI